MRLHIGHPVVFHQVSDLVLGERSVSPVPLAGRTIVFTGVIFGLSLMTFDMHDVSQNESS